MYQFQVWFLDSLDDEFEEPDACFIEAHSWVNAVQIAEVMASEKKKFLAKLDRLE